MTKNRFVINKPVIDIDKNNLEKHSVPFERVQKYFPNYILNPSQRHYGQVKKIWFGIVQFFLRNLVKIFLCPRRSLGNLDCSEIDEVYRKGSATYNYKHHLTTRGMDLVWRRMAGWLVSLVGRNQEEKIRVLDLCTGTGLTVREISLALKDWEIDADIIGLDFNENMLEIARKEASGDNIYFVQGDAMDLTSNEVFHLDFVNAIDMVTQIFGIGGIPEPLKVFDGVLRTLKSGGKFLMVDMHKPIPEHAGEWPFLLHWCRFPIFEAVVYEKSTIPIVLNRLWGWRDPTLCFYLLSLITYQDDSNRNWGFELQFFEQESQRWWFSLPIMPIAKIIVKKTEIDEETARERAAILESSVFNQ